MTLAKAKTNNMIEESNPYHDLKPGSLGMVFAGERHDITDYDPSLLSGSWLPDCPECESQHTALDGVRANECLECGHKWDSDQ